MGKYMKNASKIEGNDTEENVEAEETKESLQRMNVT